MGSVRGVLLDDSVLLAADDENGNASLQPGAEYLFRKLHHSHIRTGICYGEKLSAHKVNFLKRMALLHSFDSFILNASSINEVTLAWADIGGSILFLNSSNNKELFLKLSNCSWLIVALGDNASEHAGKLYINKLEQLPMTICHLNKKAGGNDNVIVGYVMKPSREEDFAKRGAFPMYPTQNGLMFMPLTFELPISSQLQEVDILLHKATDEIISVELRSSEFTNRITFTRGMQEMGSYMEHHPECCAVDSLINIYPVLDRLKIQQILLGLKELNTGSRCTIRAPHFLKVDNFNAPDLGQRLSEAKLSSPSIVKPQVACGVADAHSMAIVFRVEDYKHLNVPLPAVVQEYVDHSSCLFKFYVLGEKVFYAVKKSTPNADILMKLSEKNDLKPLVFDSLKSLPIAKEHNDSGDGVSSMDLGLVTDAASWLRSVLGLTIFGFDVVIQEATGDHVIVDVNYLPSFKEVPDNIAIPAFWDAIKQKFESRKTKQGTNAHIVN